MLFFCIELSAGPFRQSGTLLRKSGRLFSRCAGFFRQSDSCRAGALSAQTIPTVARHLRVLTTRSTRRLSRTPIPGFPAQTPSIRQESDGNPGIQVQMVAQARQVTGTRATSDGRTGGQHSNGPTIHSVDSTHPANPAHPGKLAAQRTPHPGNLAAQRTPAFSPPGSRPSNAPRRR